MIREYRIKPSNSTVNFDPGRRYDWSKFDWKGETWHEDNLEVFTPRIGIAIASRAPKPWRDGDATKYYVYLHVPYDWAGDQTIFRVRPQSFEAGKLYRGKMVTAVWVVEHDNGWYYWQVEFK